MHIGLQILKRRRAVDLELARAFLNIPVANVSDCMSRMTAGGPRVRPMHKGGRMAGPALTINDETLLRVEEDGVFTGFMTDWAHVRASAVRP